MDAMDQGRGRERSVRDWNSPRPEPGERESARRSRGGGDPLDQRVDRWVSAGRQFVEGVAGTRPGSRPAPRPGERASQRRPRFDELGRWVENRLDWLLDDGDDWREPWQEPDRGAPAAEPFPSPARASRRQELEAVSRRGRPASSSAPASASAAKATDALAANPMASDGDWPDEDSFTLPRWQRPAPAERSARDDALDGGRSSAEQPFTASRGGRPLPRSSRRRS